MIKLNVGGKTEGFSTRQTVLAQVKDSKLAQVAKGKDSLFIDRNPKVFSLVLDAMRNEGKAPFISDRQTKENFRNELAYWGLESFVKDDFSSENDTMVKLQEIFNGMPKYGTYE